MCVLLLALLAFVVCCKKEKPSANEKPPVACFTISINPLKAGQTEYFFNCSTNTDSVVYSFGDGQSSDTPNAQHIYASPGNYNVTVVAFQGHIKDTLTKSLTVVLPFPCDSFVGWYHITGYSQHSQPDSTYPPQSVDTYDSIFYSGPSTLGLGSYPFLNPYYSLQNQGTDTANTYTYSFSGSGLGGGSMVFHWPYNGSVNITIESGGISSYTSWNLTGTKVH